MFLINVRIQEIHFLVDLKIGSIPIFNLIKEEKFEDIIFLSALAFDPLMYWLLILLIHTENYWFQ